MAIRTQNYWQIDISPIRKLVVPTSLLVVGILFRHRFVELPATYSQMLIWLPYISLGIALLLSIFFNHSRLFAAMLAMLFAYFLVQTHLQTALIDATLLLIYSSICFAMPFTLLFLLYVPERGFNNSYGLLVSSIIPLQAGFVLIMHYSIPPAETVSLINQFLPVRPYAGYIISIPASICYLIVLCAGTIQLLRRNDEMIAALTELLMFSYFTISHSFRQSCTVSPESA